MATVREAYNADGTKLVEVFTTCPRCYGQSKVAVPSIESYDAWLAGALIQDAMPSLTIDERELLISGTCSACWDKMFGE